MMERPFCSPWFALVGVWPHSTSALLELEGGRRSTASSCRAAVRLQGRRPRSASLLIQAAGTHRPHRSAGLASGPTLEARQNDGRSNPGMINQSNSGDVSLPSPCGIAHAAFARRGTHSSKHLRSCLNPSAICAASIAPYPSMKPAGSNPTWKG